MIGEKTLRYLYEEKKMSMSEISAKIKKNQRQVDYWIKRHNIKTRSISDAIYQKHNKKGDPFLIPKFVKNKDLCRSKEFLYGLGLGLYWGEGTKRSKDSVRLGNSDPRLIKMFITFLVKTFKIRREKMKFGLQLFSDMDIEEAISYWKKFLKIPDGQLYKPLITPLRQTGHL